MKEKEEYKTCIATVSYTHLPWPFPVHGQPKAQTAEPGEPEETVFTLLESGGEDRPITRAEAAAVVVRAFGTTEEAGMQDYVDVPRDSWYRQDMARVVAMGVMQGLSLIHI